MERSKLKNYTAPLFRLVIISGLFLLLLSCTSGSDKGSGSTATAMHNEWIWISGSNTTNQAGTYGTKGLAAATNIPGGRENTVSWVDKNGYLWLFGGLGYDSVGTYGFLNDPWKFDGINWTWVSGSDIVNQAGIYGTKEISAATNIPGSRASASSRTDKGGNFWLFGGEGYDSTGHGNSELNDLWKFDGINWIWMSGSNIVHQAGTYGTKGIPAASNVPGARWGAALWIDSYDNLWLFGGIGNDPTGTNGRFNDLWKFDGSNWTWVSGADIVNQAGTYGTKGITAATNVPGTRDTTVTWIDNNNDLWLFGGYGNSSSGDLGDLNDLWKFDGSHWTWVSGDNTANPWATYGTKGIPAPINVPGPRSGALSWTDGNGIYWLFGGNGFDSIGTPSELNDLWKFDGTNWTWVSGSNIVHQAGTYGTKGLSATTNVPGARWTTVSWIDRSGNLWLFGGYGYDENGTLGDLNDLWVYQP